MSPSTARATVHRTQTAQSIVEFALILPVMLVMLLGMYDIGRAFIFGVAVQNGTREAARLGARNYLLGNDSTVDDTAILQRLIDASAPALSGCQPVTGTQPVNGCSTWVLTVSPAGAKPTGSQLTVTAVGRPSIFAGVALSVFAQQLPQITVQGRAVMEVL